MKRRIFFAFFTVILIFNFPPISMAQELRPDLMYCGDSDRTGADLYLGVGTFNEISGCVPDANTQALLVSRFAGLQIIGKGAAWLAYLNAGGVIISEKYITNEMYNEIYGTNYLDTIVHGACGNAMPSLKLNTGHPFWVDNDTLVETPVAIAGCGSDNAAIVAGEGEVTALGGLEGTAIIPFAIRPQGAGVFWLLETDWQDTLVPDNFTDDSKHFMGALISNGADTPDVVFKDSFES